ncbi:MAG: site-2 protease family protein [Chloroflexota bacterium]|nr:site-2 protease family protein [Chloroflexota bacterium]
MDLNRSVDSISALLRMAVADVLAVHDVTTGYKGSRAIRLRGQLLVEPSEAYECVAPRFKELGHTPLFRRKEGMDVILAVPGSLSSPSSKQRPWVAGALFLVTLVSVLLAGAMMAEQVQPRGLFTLRGLLKGWPFALSLLSILAAHELGHYFVARHFGVPVSLPYFIPMPLNSLGTMGAVINMQGPPRNRRQLLAIGAAGPLAGAVLAVPTLILGLLLSEVRPIPSGSVLIEGNSLLYILLKLLIFGRYLPSGGVDVFLHPVAFAGWAGLLVTGLNLIPVGQLDGGHIMHALLGRQVQWLHWGVIAALIALGVAFHWYGWFLWAGLLFLFSQRRTMLLNEITELNLPGRLLAVLMLILFILTFVPIPMQMG